MCVKYSTLHAYLPSTHRMNKPPSVKQDTEGPINTPADEASTDTKKRTLSLRFSKPTLIAKRSSYFEEQTMLQGDLDSSVSSYGSTRDEEVFSRFGK